MMDNIFSPIVQAGFAAFSVLQLIFLYRLVHEFIELTKKMYDVSITVKQLVETVRNLSDIELKILEHLQSQTDQQPPKKR